MFEVFAHQSGKFRVENIVKKSTKMQQIAHSSLKKSGGDTPNSRRL
jgi:hypothetical protein